MVILTLSVGDPSIITAKLVGMGNFGRISAPELDTLRQLEKLQAQNFCRRATDRIHRNQDFRIHCGSDKARLKACAENLFNYFGPLSKKYVELPSKEIL
ncbi:MAG: hypothetical protein ACLUKN_12115 [Bacilli bacterium]